MFMKLLNTMKINIINLLLLKYQQYIVLLPSESILNSAGIFIISVFKGSCARELAS